MMPSSREELDPYVSVRSAWGVSARPFAGVGLVGRAFGLLLGLQAVADLEIIEVNALEVRPLEAGGEGHTRVEEDTGLADVLPYVKLLLLEDFHRAEGGAEGAELPYFDGEATVEVTGNNRVEAREDGLDVRRIDSRAIGDLTAEGIEGDLATQDTLGTEDFLALVLPELGFLRNELVEQHS